MAGSTSTVGRRGRERRFDEPVRWLRLGRSSDARLAARAANGDERAFEELVRRYDAALRGYCLQLLRRVEDAEDALQDALAAAHRALLADGPPHEPRAWLFTIARNRCLSILRDRPPEATELDEIPTESAAEIVLSRAELRALVDDLGRLEPEPREALVLTRLGDLSHREVAEIMGCEPDRVRSLVRQARIELAAARLARDASCDEIRTELAELRRGGFRRAHIRRHLADCEPCRTFRQRLAGQDRTLGLALPVPAALALQALGGTAEGAAVGTGGGAAAGTGAAAATGGTGGVATAGGGLALAGSKAVATVAAGAALVGGGVAITGEVLDSRGEATRGAAGAAGDPLDASAVSTVRASRSLSTADASRERAGERSPREAAVQGSQGVSDQEAPADSGSATEAGPGPPPSEPDPSTPRGIVPEPPPSERDPSPPRGTHVAEPLPSEPDGSSRIDPSSDLGVEAIDPPSTEGDRSTRRPPPPAPADELDPPPEDGVETPPEDGVETPPQPGPSEEDPSGRM